MAREIDEKVNNFLKRPVDTYIPFLFVDASYFKVRDGVRYVHKALFVVAGVRSDGYPENFTFSIADAEHELTREEVFSDLPERGLNKVDLVIYVGHNGSKTAAETTFPGSSWQMCHVHFIRAIIRKILCKYHKEIAETLNECLNDSRRLEEFRCSA